MPKHDVPNQDITELNLEMEYFPLLALPPSLHLELLRQEVLLWLGKVQLGLTWQGSPVRTTGSKLLQFLLQVQIHSEGESAPHRLPEQMEMLRAPLRPPLFAQAFSQLLVQLLAQTLFQLQARLHAQYLAQVQSKMDARSFTTQIGNHIISSDLMLATLLPREGTPSSL